MVSDCVFNYFYIVQINQQINQSINNQMEQNYLD